MSEKFLAVSYGSDDIFNETKKFKTILKSRKNSIQSYNDTFINNYYHIKVIKNATIPQIITKTNKIDTNEPISIKITTENDNIKSTNFVTTDDIISSPMTPSIDDEKKTPTSIYLSPTISRLVNDINESLNERITAIRNKNNEMKKEILDKVINFKDNQHELILNLLNKYEYHNLKNKDNNNINENKLILYELLSKIKNDNIEFLNKIDSSLIYNVNMKYSRNNDYTTDKDVISFTNSNGENKTVVFLKINEVYHENDELKNNEKEPQESTLIESSNINKTKTKSNKKAIDKTKNNNDNSNNASNSSIKRFMKMTGIYKLPYMNSMAKQSSSDVDIVYSTKNKRKSKLSIFKRKDPDEGVNGVSNNSLSSKFLELPKEYNAVRSFNASYESLSTSNELSSNDIHSIDDSKIKHRRFHTKCYSETIGYNDKMIEFNAPVPISNSKHSSISTSGFDDKQSKLTEKDKKNKEKEKRKEEEKEKKLKEKEKKKEEEKEKKIKEKKRKSNIYRTESSIEIERRMKNVFDNYQVKLIGREPGAYPILTNEIANKILPNITPSAYKEYRNWRLLYSLEYHGSHPQTMYDAVNEKMPLVTAIMDEDGCIFGAYNTEYFHVDTHYYGNGQTFLWKYKVDENNKGELQTFKATGSNHYYIISEKRYLAFGGGKGFGLHLTDEFTYGFTDNCETYNNDILACKRDFKCINIEVWCLEI